VSPEIRAVVDAADRDPKDKALDGGRKPGELLTFAGVKPGMKVADLAAGTGYTTELLARAVGSTGKVWGQNGQAFAKFIEPAWTERLKKPAMQNVVRVDRELDDPLPPEAKDLDVVLNVLFYHDSVWLGADRAKMNKAVFAALRSGGVYGIVDHAGRDGTGTSEAQTLHRIEEKVVRDEVLASGLASESEGTEPRRFVVISPA